MSTTAVLNSGIDADMPFKPYWLERLPEIIERVNAVSETTIDRSAFESIFELRRRRAIDLMHLLGSYRGRRGFLLDRSALIEKLESLDTITQHRWVREVRETRQTKEIGRGEGAPVIGQNETQQGRGRLVIEFADRKDLIEKLRALLCTAT